MLRRDLLIGSAATAAVGLSPLTLQAQQVETYHENIRRRALKASSVLLCWGQRSGKSHIMSQIAGDRLKSGLASRIVFVTCSPTQESTAVAQLNQLAQVEPLFESCKVAAQDFLSGAFSKHGRESDIILFEEIDWMWGKRSHSARTVSSHSLLLQRAYEFHPNLVMAVSSPSQEHGGFLSTVKFCEGHPIILADHATSFEVNPALRVEDFASEPHFVRDFLAYKVV